MITTQLTVCPFVLLPNSMPTAKLLLLTTLLLLLLNAATSPPLTIDPLGAAPLHPLAPPQPGVTCALFLRPLRGVGPTDNDTNERLRSGSINELGMAGTEGEVVETMLSFGSFEVGP